MTKYLLEMFAVSLLLTLVLEVPLAWCIGMRRKKELLLVLLINVLTNPAAVLLHWLGIPQLPIEAAVLAIEAALYRWFSKDEKWNVPYPVRLALCCNVFSYLSGVVIQWIGG